MRSRPAPPTSGEALRLTAVTKIYDTPSGPVAALNGVTVSLSPGTFTSVMGPSGSGKSTMLQCAAGLDEPTAGEILVAGQGFPHQSEAKRTVFRRDRIGFVFQQYNLVPYLTVMENLGLPLRLAGRRVDRSASVDLLARLGMSELAGRRPAELSGGQQQRVAIARALVARPAVLFADEPTGALDAAGGRDVLGLLREAVDSYGQTVVMVTHDPNAAAYGDTVLFLADGTIVDQLAHPTPGTIADRMVALDGLVAGRSGKDR